MQSAHHGARSPAGLLESDGAAPLDTVREVSTPEGIEIELHPAGVFARASAWVADFVLRLCALLLLMLAMSVLGKFGWGIVLLAWFFLEWIFPAWCEVHWGGATPGKKWLRLAVVHDDGTPVGWSAALTRNLLRFVDFLPVLYVFGLVSMIASHGFKRLGDHAAGTLVVYQPAVPLPRRVPAAPPEAPAQALSRESQRAVLDYAERVPDLTPERAAELAELAGPLVEPAHGEAAVARMLRFANHLLGRT